MEFILRVLRDPRAAIVFSIVIGISIVTIFADFCVSKCIVTNAPKYAKAPSFQQRVKGQCIWMIPTLVKHKENKDLFVEFG